MPAQPLPELTTFLNSIWSILVNVAVILFVICVIVAGVMRMISFGNERRIALSNMALTAAVIGLVIVLLAVVLQGWLLKLLPAPNPSTRPGGAIQAFVDQPGGPRVLLVNGNVPNAFSA
ncbi:MAG TPA: hypothetical protein VL485_15600 [Ktedonobacteraceae bacterium]|jgi:hypothetical protein|nr:hypothetical protein [Ktedonobacteraceae bacterium]